MQRDLRRMSTSMILFREGPRTRLIWSFEYAWGSEEICRLQHQVAVLVQSSTMKDGYGSNVSLQIPIEIRSWRESPRGVAWPLTSSAISGIRFYVGALGRTSDGRIELSLRCSRKRASCALDKIVEESTKQVDIGGKSVRKQE